MAEALLETAQVIEAPDMSQIITEDDEPVDNMFSEKQQRLLVEPLYSSWNPGRPFIAAANVGVFNAETGAVIVFIGHVAFKHRVDLLQAVDQNRVKQIGLPGGNEQAQQTSIHRTKRFAVGFSVVFH